MDFLHKPSPKDAPAAGLEQRLLRLCRVLESLPDGARRFDDAVPSSALERLDDAMKRIRELATTIDDASSRWDALDHAAARLLLYDLTVAVRDLRAVAAKTGANLEAVVDRTRELHADHEAFLRSVESD